MGYRYLDRALRYSAMFELRDRTALVLLGMAHRCWDEPHGSEPAGIYSAGWPYLATVWLRYPSYTRAAEKAVEREAIRLRNLGVVKPLSGPQIGRSARYRLHLSPTLENPPTWWVDPAGPPDTQGVG